MHFSIPAAVLDTLNFGIFVVDADRRPIYTNAKATELLTEGRVFQLDKLGGLRVAESADDRALKESIGILRRAPGMRNIRPVPVHARGASPMMFAWVSLLPVAAGNRSLVPSAAGSATTVMVTGRSLNAVGKEVLADLFKLTQAESRLVQCLLQGMSPSQYALRRGLSQNTVRNQLKSIFEKTEVRRQSDLVNLVWNVLVPVNFDVSADE
jgi:DNA-binding CsgD family transcriptional regulator